MLQIRYLVTNLIPACYIEVVLNAHMVALRKVLALSFAALLSLGLLAFFPVSHVFAAGTQVQVWIDTTVVTNQCGQTLGLNFTAPTTNRPPAVGDYNFCTQVASNEGVFLPASATVQLWGAGGSGESFNMSFYDVTDGNFTIFNFTNVPVDFGGAATCNSPQLMTLTLPGSNGHLETSFTVADAVFQAIFHFSGPVGTTPPSICDSPSARQISLSVALQSLRQSFLSEPCCQYWLPWLASRPMQ
jgi:hypothetical protein